MTAWQTPQSRLPPYRNRRPFGTALLNPSPFAAAGDDAAATEWWITLRLTCFIRAIIRRRIAACLSCGLSRRFPGNPARAKPLRGTKRPRGDHLKCHRGYSGDHPLHHVESEIGTKILPHDPA